MDLSNYVRVGRYDLPEPTRSSAPSGNLLAQEASGVAYNPDSDTLFIVGDGGRSITEVTKSGQFVSTMTLAAGSSPQGTAFYDPEGITYVGKDANGKYQFVFTEERDRNAVLITYEAGATKGRADAQVANLGTFVPNIGLEGVSYDPATGGFIFVKEISPIGVFQTTIDFATNTASNGSASTLNSVNLFDPAKLGLSDVADVFALSNIQSLAGTAEANNLLILSQEDGRVVEVDRAGNILSQLVIQTDQGNPLGVADQQHEGITVDKNGFIYIVSENGGGNADHPQLWVYAPSNTPNSAPTAITLGNALPGILENTGTSTRIKVADVLVTDDGIGNNALSVSGADAAFFEVDSTGLYLKAGTILDFESKTSYAVSVSVNDATVGANPDATVNYVLNVTDVANEVVAPKLYISEVAPWSSGNSPVGFDWFEVTNNSNTAIDITGWKMDDDSASFSNARALNGVTSIGARESVIFFETANLEAAKEAFIANWFNGVAPAGLKFGSYTGAGVGLSTSGDQVNLYNAAGQLQAKVSFGASPANSPFATFNNAGAINNGAITALSTVGTNGAFSVTHGLTTEIGSPGTVGKLFISEVAPWASGDSPVGADWFEVTNTTGLAISLAGWKIDDNSQSPVAAVALNGVSEIGAGESVIFVNGGASAVTAFVNTWFGGKLPAGLKIGTYDGSGVGLSGSGDAVNLYDSTNTLRASVFFGASTTPPGLATFDNAAGLNNVGITQLSSIGVNGAYQIATALGSTETGSPGTIKTLIDPTNLAPTAITLLNATTAIDENTSTIARIKVASVAVTDDGKGFNALGLTGADAALFEVDATGLYLKAGTTLDFETKASYAVTVTVNDPTVGGNPDASISYILGVNNIVNETGGPAIRITEVAPWSSGNTNSTVGQDWFEITNVSEVPVNLTGWRFDDDSSSLAESAALQGIPVILPGESVIFLNSANLEPLKTAFINTWFGGIAPVGVRFGTYAGAGLGTGGDAVTLFDASGAIAAKVTFGSSTSAPALSTFDNAAGLDNVLLTNLASSGVNGAFTITNGKGNTETGSPGTVTTEVFDKVLKAGVGGGYLAGGAGNDKIDGLGGNDTILGLGGHDVIGGGAGDDNLQGGNGNDLIDGGVGKDRIDGGEGNDVLLGGDGADYLTGGSGNDFFLGGRGTDGFLGGAGADIFAFEFTTDSPAGAADFIKDFSSADGDRINLSAIDAVTGGADDAFVLVSAFTKVAGQLVITYYNTTVQGANIYGDVNGDGLADFQILVQNVTALGAADIAL